MAARQLIGMVLAGALAAGCSASHDGDGDGGTGTFDTAGLDALGGGDAHPVDGSRPPGDTLSGADSPLGWADVPLRDAAIPDVRLRDIGVLGDGLGDTWDGYIESFAFPSGSDRLRIEFDSTPAPGGVLTGVVIFGEGAPPPPVTDPSVGYPPGAGDARFGRVHEGFRYRIREATVTSSRVLVTIDLGEVWEVWCQLQTPYPLDEGAESFWCAPNYGSGSSDDGCVLLAPDGPQVVDCGWLSLCQGSTCQCTAAGCVANTGNTLRFDFSIAGDRGDGSVRIGDLYNIHLTRE